MDRYELVGEIASGGMATVYLARRAGVGGFQRFVAIKRLHTHLAQEAEFVEMFLDEARLAALIHHPNVISITEVGSSERGYYLVMDYVEGDTLARLLTLAAEQDTIMPIGVGLRIIIDMLTGLHAAHELTDDQGVSLGLVHRDVSPQNVLVGSDGIARLSDFGVARAAIRLAGTRVGQLKGKIAYMSPEQAAADEGIDRRADVFAAGIVLWEVLTGRRLFKSTNDAATLSRVVTERIEAPLSLVAGLDTRVSDICMKALERPLARRYQTAAAFADQLEYTASRRGLLATSKEVSAYLHKVLGAEITEQREAVRRWISISDSGEEGTPTGASRLSLAAMRSELISLSGEAPESSSKMRAILGKLKPDGGLLDETQVAPSPHFGLNRQALWVAIASASIIVVLLAYWAISPRSTAVRGGAAVTVIPIVGSPSLDPFPPSAESGPTKGEGSSESLGLGHTSTAAPEHPATATTSMPGTAPKNEGGASTAPKTTKPQNVAPTTKPTTPVIPDVDLTNPYR